jgi:twinkle protein
MKEFQDFGIEIPHTARGSEVDTTCPQCSATRRKKYAKCLSVNLDEGIWLCHHCGWNGTLKQGVGKRYEPQHRQYAKPKIYRLTPLPEKVIAWFGTRGIPESVLAHYRVGWGEVYFSELEDQAYAMQFPYYRNSELVNVKYRTLDKKFRMATGAERILYGVDDIAGNKSLIWVEGEIDKLSVEVAGLTSCVSVPDGAPDAKSKNYESKFSFLESAEDALADVQEHILAVDNDANGKRLEEELARRLGVEKCKRVAWPEGCKDANDVLVNHGADRLARCLLEAESYPVDGLLEVRNISRSAWDLYEHGLTKGLSTGWPKLDAFYTVKPGQLTVISGIPAHGKSSWVQAMAVNMARQHHWRFAFFSPEDAPLERLVNALAQKLTGETITEGYGHKLGADGFEKALTWLQEHFYFIEPEEMESSSLSAILHMADVAVLRYGIRGLIIDPWNELEHARPRELTESEYIGQALKQVRQFSRSHAVHTWVIGHPTKLYKRDDGSYPAPTLYDMSGSANWRNKPDNGVIIYRPSTDNHDAVEVHIQKIKFAEIGKPGVVQMAYHRATGRFSEVS